MNKLFNRLLVSAPNGGGLFLINDAKVLQLDGVDTTGMAMKKDIFLRAQQPASLWICRDQTTEIDGQPVAFSDIHDVLVHEDGIYVVSTADNEIIKLSLADDRVQRWRFSGAQDSRHINCLAAWNNKIVFSAFGDFQSTEEYKGRTKGAGAVHDLLSGNKLIEGLSQPHSLVPHGRNLLLANSEEKEIREYAPNGSLVRARKLDGYTRGVCISGDIIYVGLSRSRNVEDVSISTGALVALDLYTWKEVGRISLPVNEVYSLVVIDDAVTLLNIVARAFGHSSAKSSQEIRSIKETVRSQIASLNDTISKRDGQLSTLQHVVSTQEERLRTFKDALAASENRITVLIETVSVRDSHIAALTQTISERDAQFGVAQQIASAQREEIERLTKLKGLLEKEIAESNGRLAKAKNEANERQEKLSAAINAQNTKIVRLTKAILDRDNRIAALHGLAAETDKQIVEAFSQLSMQLENADRLQSAYQEVQQQRERLQTELQHSMEKVSALSVKLNDYEHELDRVVRRNKQLLAENESLKRLNAEMREILEKERLTVWRPIARRLYRQARTATRRLPAPIGNILKKFFYTLVLRFSPACALAQRYKDFLRATSASTQAKLYANTISVHLKDENNVPSVGGSRFTVLVFPIIDWNFRFQRPQQLALQLARQGHTVFYLHTTFSSAGKKPQATITETPFERVHLCKLSCPEPHPIIYSESTSQEQRLWMVAALQELIDGLEPRPAIAILDLGFWRGVANRLSGIVTIYDCMDFHAGFSNVSDAMLIEEENLLAEADAVIASSLGLFERIGRIRPCALIRNAADVRHFSQEPPTIAFDKRRPTAGYIGAIAEWFDVSLVYFVAGQRPEWDFVLVGSTAGADVTSLASLPNVKLIGEVPYEMVASYVHGFDVCLIPFKLNDLILHTNPVKVYEYLSAGKPVVATPLPELQVLEEGLVHLAGSKDDFLSKLDLAMQESEEEALSKRRKNWASIQTWEERGKALASVIDTCFPKVSVIVLCFNNLEFTKACLYSLDKHTKYPNWELILVDNASTDGTAEYLTEYANRHNHVRLILNSENRGFAGGNNVGLRASDGEYIILLNNDTYVTDGWITDLLRPLRRYADIGLVGPVTNNCGNEARIDIHYSTMEEMIERARHYTSSHHRELVFTETIAFFCVGMPRRIYEQIGDLDESFEVGFFEDDDYCRRVQTSGYRIAIVEDVFVHHHLSATFAKLGDANKREIFERNRKVYEAKWGPWKPHQYRPSNTIVRL